MGKIWGLCPRRHGLLILSLCWLIFYFCLREKRELMNFLCRYLVRPWHRLAGRVYSLLPFSVAEWLILAWIVMGLWLLGAILVRLLRKNWQGAYRAGISLLTFGSVLFGLFSLWWGVFYYSDSFQDQSGLVSHPVSVEELEDVTRYFVELANQYSGQVVRDSEGVYTVDVEDLLDRSQTLCHEVQALFPCLEGPDLRAKPVVFSRFMSRINYTGFFFPYTAEANVNVDSPLCMLPSTIAHELAHQRGVAGEDEANFVAVLACLESGDPDFIYSAALMAYVYLGNALNRTDYQTWYDVYYSLNEDVRRDLQENNRYWAAFETKMAEVSEQIYETFLRTYGDDRGMQSYGACVDLLVMYYGGEAAVD